MDAGIGGRKRSEKELERSPPEGGIAQRQTAGGFPANRIEKHKGMAGGKNYMREVSG